MSSIIPFESDVRTKSLKWFKDAEGIEPVIGLLPIEEGQTQLTLYIRNMTDKLPFDVGMLASNIIVKFSPENPNLEVLDIPNEIKPGETKPATFKVKFAKVLGDLDTKARMSEYRSA